MAKDFAISFYRSQLWQRTRELYIKSVDGICEDCLAKGIYRPGKIVHHIIPLTSQNIKDMRIATDFKNLRYVCMDCHASAHATGSVRRYKFDDDGNIIYKENADDS